VRIDSGREAFREGMSVGLGDGAMMNGFPHSICFCERWFPGALEF
jgi:hypothetical protein